MSISNIESLPPLRQIVEEHQLWANKGFGQNYLFDLNLTRKIARAAQTLPHQTFFEIGPGPGGLTRALLMEQPDAKIIAVEMDRRFIEALQPLIEASENRLRIIEGDATKTDLVSLAPAPRSVVANLPYNVGTELLISWLHRATEFTQFILMFQREVAERIVAKPDTKAYGRLSVLAQSLCDTKILFNVPAGAFIPPPKVTSSIIELKPRSNAGDIPVSKLETITAAAFGQRRKMLRQSLKSFVPVLEELGIDPQKRAENLTVTDYLRIANAI